MVIMIIQKQGREKKTKYYLSDFLDLFVRVRVRVTITRFTESKNGKID